MKSKAPTQTLKQLPEDRWFGLATLVFSGLLYSIHVQETLEPTLGDPGPALVPTVVAALLTLLGLRLLLKPHPDAAPTEPEGIWRPVRGAATVVAVLVYAWLLPRLGYPISTAVFFAVSTWLLGRLTVRALGLCLLVALAVAFGTDWLLSSVLNVSLPEGEWLYALKGVLNV